MSGNSNPIGVFDSGVGGLTVWRELIKMLPHENTIYFADSKNCPYGSKKLKEIRELTFAIVKFLLSKKCKLILIACNSISASIINELRKVYPDVPFVGMEPAIKVAASLTDTKNIGVLATEATVNGELYNKTKQIIPEEININVQIGHSLVELVEAGELESQEVSDTLKKYINSFLNNAVDNVVLGCTHYPFLIDKMKEISGNKINYIDPAQAVIKQVERLLVQYDIQNSASNAADHQMYSSGKNFPVKKLLPDLNYSNIKITTNFVL
ncbi:MAG: glutamate racemase [Ignavibacteria bacterium RBG_13_36_8]|nr:MAG: glutamate racemase [Ignavibacteria bacterium RBG_13_36_8]